MQELTSFVCLCMYLSDDDLVDVETCRQNTSHSRLFIIDCAVCTLPSFFHSQNLIHPTLGSYSNRGALIV